MNHQRKNNENVWNAIGIFRIWPSIYTHGPLNSPKALCYEPKKSVDRGEGHYPHLSAPPRLVKIHLISRTSSDINTETV